MTETMARTRAAHRRRVSGTAIAAVGCLAAIVPLLDHLADPPRATVVARNDTVWDLGLVVRTGEGSVMAVATVGSGRAAEVREVLVPGDTWELVWRFEGDDVATSVVPHDDLVAAGFVLEVPDEVERALRAADAPPTP